MRVVLLDDEVEQLAGQRRVLARGGQLEAPEPHEAGRDPADHRPGLQPGPPVVELVPDDAPVAREREAEGARGRDPQRVHGLRGDKLSHGGAEHRAPVGEARVRGRPGAFQLELVEARGVGQRVGREGRGRRRGAGGGAGGGGRARGGLDVAQADRPPVPELPREAPELVPRVGCRVRAHPGRQLVLGHVPGEERREGAARLALARVEAEQVGGDLARDRNDFLRPSPRRRRRGHEGEGCPRDLADGVGGVRVGGEGRGEGGAPSQVLSPWGGRGGGEEQEVEKKACEGVSFRSDDASNKTHSTTSHLELLQALRLGRGGGRGRLCLRCLGRDA